MANWWRRSARFYGIEPFMQLKTLLAALAPTSVEGPLDREITSIAYDSRRVQPGALFVALKGARTDGTQFIAQAVEKGAEVVVSEARELKSRATNVLVPNAREALADLASEFYERP